MGASSGDVTCSECRVLAVVDATTVEDDAASDAGDVTRAVDVTDVTLAVVMRIPTVAVGDMIARGD